ncbi:MAG: SelB C-terminal domain-containing protein [Candidatus Aminicenantales bacterium]
MIESFCFEAKLTFLTEKASPLREAVIVYQKRRLPCSIYYYQHLPPPTQDTYLVRIHSGHGLRLKWKDNFELWAPAAAKPLAIGIVLNPRAKKIGRTKEKKQVSFLQKLMGNEKQMLLALIENKGKLGLHQKEILSISSISKKDLLRYSLELEEAGQVRILSFSPLWLLFKPSFDFICQKILAFIGHYHRQHPKEEGVSISHLKKRFELPFQILYLAINRLAKEKKIRSKNRIVALFDFRPTLSLAEKRTLQQLEEMFFQGKLRSFSWEELGRKFHLSPSQLNRLLSYLTENKKIIQSKDGFIVHSYWLDEVISKLKQSGKRELSVADFKKLTGLSRKYAIPLLELLDELGITKRKGTSRQII